MLSLIRRFGIQAAFIATLCACASGKNESTDAKLEGFESFSEAKRKEIFLKHTETLLIFAADYRTTRGLSPKDAMALAIGDARRARPAMAAQIGITEEQFTQILKEGADKRWAEHALADEGVIDRSKIKPLAKKEDPPKEKAETPERQAKREAAELAAKKEADRVAAEMKAAQDEIDANKLYEKVTARAHLLEIVAKYPNTRAAKLAKERLDKLDKKK